MKKTIMMILSLMLVLCMITGCTVVNVAKVGSVNGEDIPLGVYKYAMKIAEIYFGQMDEKDELSEIAYYAAYYYCDSYTSSLVYTAISDILAEAGVAEEGKSIWEKAYGETTVGEAVKDAVYEEIVKAYVLSAKAAEKEISLTAEETESISNMKNNFYSAAGNKSAFDKKIGTANLTSNQLVDFWSKIALSSKLSSAMAEENIVTEEEIKAYFDENYMRVKHILIKTGEGGEATMEDAKAVAEEILVKLSEGEDFEAIMKAQSDDLDAEGNVNGGDEGYIFKEGDFGNPAFEDASKALAVGEYTKELVEVKGGSYEGYHIIKRYAMPAGYFEENKDNLTSVIEAAIDNEAFEPYVESVIAESDAEKKASKIKGVKLYSAK